MINGHDRVTWTVLKSFVDARGLSIQYTESSNRYNLIAIDGPYSVGCELKKNYAPHAADVATFEATYKALGNVKFGTFSFTGGKLEVDAEMSVPEDGLNVNVNAGAELNKLRIEMSTMNDNLERILKVLTGMYER